MSMLVDCSNCRTTLNLPPGARSIRCSVCQAITRIADSSESSLPPPQQGVSPFPGLAGFVPSPSPYNHAPPSNSDVSPFPGLAMHVPSPSPYNHDPPSPSPSRVSPFPGLAAHMPSPSPYNHAQPGTSPYVHGRKKAVIVGISYKNTRHELKGCINDAKCIKYLLISRFQFPESSIIMLTGKNPNLLISMFPNLISS